MTEEFLYFDNNATTAPAPEVRAAMTDALTHLYGNPSSGHRLGQRSAFAVAQARRQLARCINALPAELIFTSGGTEASNLAIFGLTQAQPQKRHLITSSVEHDAVNQPLQQLQTQGYEVTRLAVNGDGAFDLSQLQAALRPDSLLVSLMLANNETGILLPVAEAARLCREMGVLIHTDAVQAIGKIPVDVQELGVDLLSLSAHKFHGPKGCGALYVRAGVILHSQMLGANQERGLRAGTENVPGIVGLGMAVELVSAHLPAAQNRMTQLGQRLESALIQLVSDGRIIGRQVPRLPNTCLLQLPRTATEELLIALSEHGVCVSTGSACHSGALTPSGVLQAMGLDDPDYGGALRISWSRYTTMEEVDRLLQILPVAMNKIQSPV
ncbi:MAG: Cysteine desulfurase IscS [Phycisphaerae bacterium]|nr:Cysteine desulfurase IscS [Phycisphaerae bacterium]